MCLKYKKYTEQFKACKGYGLKAVTSGLKDGLMNFFENDKGGSKGEDKGGAEGKDKEVSEGRRSEGGERSKLPNAAIYDKLHNAMSEAKRKSCLDKTCYIHPLAALCCSFYATIS